MNKSSDSTPLATRERLLDAAMHLFADRGMTATTVGDIEAAAGLAARSGALYKYFDSKHDLLAAGLERHLATIDDIEEQLALRPLGEMKSEVTLLGRWLLHELEAERHITHVLEREGERVPDLRGRMRSGISDRGYRIGAMVLGRWRPELPEAQREQLAVVLIGALINYKRSAWTFGAAPLGLTEDEMLESWVDVCLAAGPPSP